MAASTHRTSALIWRHARLLRLVAAAFLLLLGLIAWTTGADTPRTAPVTVASRDIGSGAVISARDLTTGQDTLGVATPAAEAVVGETARGPIAAGEPVTESRLAPGRLVEPPAGTVVFPLTLEDERIASLLMAGDRVDVLVTPDSLHEGEPRVAVDDVEVVAVPDTGQEGSGSLGRAGSVVLLSITPDQAAALAGVRRSDHVSVAIR